MSFQYIFRSVLKVELQVGIFWKKSVSYPIANATLNFNTIEWNQLFLDSKFSIVENSIPNLPPLSINRL